MASLSSLSPVLRQQSSFLSLRLRHGSAALAKSSSCSSRSCFSTQSQTCRSQLSKRSPSSAASSASQQLRSITTRVARPFAAKSSSTSTKSSAPVEPSLPMRSASLDPPLPLTNLPYFIRRTASNQLPVYMVTKSGGTRQETKLQKTEGDVDALRSDLARWLGLDQNSPDIVINRLNGHIIVKGWRKPEIQQFLLERKF